MLKVNEIYNCDCLQGLRSLDEGSIDLTVTSPPYDDLRTYDNTCSWNFDIFKPIADELYRVTRNGGVVVWVIGDAAIDGGETGSSFRQALYFQEIGFKLHDTMIYEKNSSTFPARLTSKRYSQIFEYMFVFVKGKKIRDDIKLIADKKNKWAGWTNWGDHSQYDVDGNLNKTSNIKPIAEFSLRTNIWRYPVSFNDKTGHPAVFPEKLAEDHILSWSIEGDTVLDPFMGSGTTAKMAMLNGRKYIGFEKNADYWKVSLERVAKYKGKKNEDLSGVTINNIDLTNIEEEDIDIYNETLNVNVKEDKDIPKKAELWKKLVTELEDYFNEQSYGILKNLKLTFASKANDARVQKVIQEKNLEPIAEESVFTKPTLQEIGASIEYVEEPQTLKAVGNIDESPDIIESTLAPEGDDPLETRFKDIEKRLKTLEDEIFQCKILGTNSCETIGNCQETLDKHIGDVSEEYYCPTSVIHGAPFKNLIANVEKKKRGRPKGSKNKPKENIDENSENA